MRQQHPGANKIHFRGKFWAIDSWDGETARVQMLNQQGDVMEEWSTQAMHGHHNADANFPNG
jgi:hypothetical protein